VIYRILFILFSGIQSVATRTKVTGRENMPSGACIIVANHVNLLDSPILGINMGRRVFFMAKEELFGNRLISFFAQRFGAFPVRKGRLDRRAGRAALDHLNNGDALVVFPEGKRSPNGRLGPAYGGAALLARRTGALIVPVGITGTGSLTGKAWFLKRPLVRLKIGNPFTIHYGDDKLTREATAGYTQEIMLNIAAQLPVEYHGRYHIQTST
jgi:1-acyl-sn-glycerol-3-phosphate acyltransferase